MRKTIVGIVAAVALVGCSAPDGVELDYRAELNASARGVEVNDDGTASNVGMFDTTCDVDTTYAGIGEDYDYDNSTEVVVDGELTPAGDTYLVLTPGNVHVTTPDGVQTQHTLEVGGSPVGAQLTGEGNVVTVTPDGGDCNVVVYDSAGNQLSLVQLGVECDQQSSVTTDAVNGTTWVSTDSGIYEVAEGQVTRVSDLPNALLAHDPAAEVVYAGVAGRAVVTAIEPGGAERWETQVDGAITALTDLGDRASAAVSVAQNGTGAFLVIDGLTGEVTSDLPTPSSALGLSSSGTGQVVAITLPDTVFYFDVNAVE